jgi:hypothetical protein
MESAFAEEFKCLPGKTAFRRVLVLASKAATGGAFGANIYSYAYIIKSFANH